MHAPLRSDTLPSTPVTAYLLFESPVQFTLDEVVAATSEAYPSVTLRDDRNLGMSYDTSMPVVAALHAEVEGGHAQLSIAGLPGRLSGDLKSQIDRAGEDFPQAGKAVSGHTDHLSISVQHGTPDGPIRSAALRVMVCVAAVLAAKGGATAAYIAEIDRLIDPAALRGAADRAAAGDNPFSQSDGSSEDAA